MDDLKSTVDMMISDDYKERFKAEYHQLVIRFGKLRAMLEKWDSGELSFTPTCNRGILNMQARIMADYITVLESRAQIEGIVLSDDSGNTTESANSLKAVFLKDSYN